MKIQMFSGLIVALLCAGLLPAQPGAVPGPPLWLEITPSIPLGIGEIGVVSGDAITLGAFFEPDGTMQDYALLATACPPSGSLCWEILAMGAVPPDQYLAWDGVVPALSPPCSFMLALAGHDGSGWWYISQPLLVHAGYVPPQDPPSNEVPPGPGTEP